jgi:hypothetical protein
MCKLFGIPEYFLIKPFEIECLPNAVNDNQPDFTPEGLLTLY